VQRRRFASQASIFRHRFSGTTLPPVPVLFSSHRSRLAVQESIMTSTLNLKTTWQDRLAVHWTTYKPLALVLAVGLVAGPLISNYMGWQVTRGAAERQSQASAVDQQAMICSVLARVENPNPAGLDWSARRDLAEKHAIMPGRTVADSNVVSACINKLLVA
jgi:hypothetical protein